MHRTCLVAGSTAPAPLPTNVNSPGGQIHHVTPAAPQPETTPAAGAHTCASSCRTNVTVALRDGDEPGSQRREMPPLVCNVLLPLTAKQQSACATA